jgi:TRAP-type C4-dicarboxylate transport system permease large subunit
VSLSLFCVGAAGVFGFLLAYYKLPAFMLGLTEIASTKFLLLALISIIFLVLGTFLDGLVIVIICAPLFLPAVTQLGVDPVHYGIVGCISIAMGLITPPYGLCLLLASSIGKIPMQKAFPDTFRLLGVMLIVLLVVIAVPEIALALVHLTSR